jgi:H+/Cl- antiporter ClcA
MRSSTNNSGFSRWLVFGAVTVLTGVTSGIGGLLLVVLLRIVQHNAYGYSLRAIVTSETFLEGVTSAAPLRRFLVLAVCGIVAGVGWWALYRFARPLVSVTSAVKENGPAMPLASTVVHALLQIVTVALGSPLGREAAPRELGALFADRLSKLSRLTPQDRRIIIACGAGAGLAAVYNVPLGGALFTLEGLLGTFSLSAFIPALATSVIAALVARAGLGNFTAYSIPALSVTPSLIAWSILAGPLFGAAAYVFVKAAAAARRHAPRDIRLLPWCLLVFPAIGLLAIPFPQLLGNGKGIAQLGFDSELGLATLAALLLLRLLVSVAALRAGAAGGSLTPGIALGVILGSILGGFWRLALPSTSLGAFALVGGAAFLASSMKMPLTAIVLMFEFTRAGLDFVVPISLAVVGSITMFQILTNSGIKHTESLQHRNIADAGETDRAELSTPQAN